MKEIKIQELEERLELGSWVGGEGQGGTTDTQTEGCGGSGCGGSGGGGTIVITTGPKPSTPTTPTTNTTTIQPRN